jgi:hypothetical protein
MIAGWGSVVTFHKMFAAARFAHEELLGGSWIRLSAAIHTGKRAWTKNACARLLAGLGGMPPVSALREFSLARIDLTLTTTA